MTTDNQLEYILQLPDLRFTKWCNGVKRNSPSIAASITQSMKGFMKQATYVCRTEEGPSSPSCGSMQVRQMTGIIIDSAVGSCLVRCIGSVNKNF